MQTLPFQMLCLTLCPVCRILRPAPFVYQGMCQLFEMFFLTVFNTFSEVSVADLMKEQIPMVCS